MNEKITLRIVAVLTALVLVMVAVTPAYAAGDTTIPTLTAVVNNGMLTVDATDDASGIAAIYVNGFEFTELNNGSLTIRMQQYDTGYQYFTMQAKDGAGNLSEVYRVNNPYYSFPDEDNGEEVEEPELPTDAQPTEPSEAEADVTDHIKTDSDGNKKESTVKSSSSSTKSSSSSAKSSSSSVKKSGVEEDDDDYEIDSATVSTSEGREFYTIMTKTGKVFYLVIDRNCEEEKVHFLTDITENDLLNVTSDNKPTLPQNSAVVIKDAGLQDMSAGAGRDGEKPPEEEEKEEETVSEDSLLIDDTASQTGGEDQVSDNTAPEKTNVVTDFIKDHLFIIIICVIALIAGIFAKLLKRNDKDAAYKEDEEEGYDEDYPDDSEEYPDEEEDSNSFMDRTDDRNEGSENGVSGNNSKNDPDEPVKLPEQISEETYETETEEKEHEAQEEREDEQENTDGQSEQPEETGEKQAEEELPEQEKLADKSSEEEPSEDLQVSGRTITDPDGMYTASSHITNGGFKNTEETIYI